MTLEEEIYNKLVEQFGVGEICIKKHGKRKQLTWLEFISATLTFETTKLYNYCGFNGSSGFSKYFTREFFTIMNTKNSRQWHTFLPSLIDKKQCSKCKEVRLFSEFNLDKLSVFNTQSICKDCRANYWEENKEELAKCRKEYYTLNSAYLATQKKKYNELNRDTISVQKKIYYQNNKYLYTAKTAKRRAAKLQATPKWADLEKIKEMYHTCPKGYHVDHIVPLQNELVCGLHVHENLQHLSAKDNLSKSNKFNVT